MGWGRGRVFFSTPTIVVLVFLDLAKGSKLLFQFSFGEM